MIICRILTLLRCRFINNACKPSTVPRDGGYNCQGGQIAVMFDHNDRRMAHLAFYPLRDLEAGEEILLKYAQNEGGKKAEYCKCISCMRKKYSNK